MSNLQRKARLCRPALLTPRNWPSPTETVRQACNADPKEKWPSPTSVVGVGPAVEDSSFELYRQRSAFLDLKYKGSG